MADRYIRQTDFADIGNEGQERLAESKVAIVGLGAVGSMAANLLARAGVGSIRLIDRDFVEETNLQRHMIYTEDDVRNEIPKADAVLKFLKSVNSGISLEAVVADANSSTIDSMISDVDLILDGSDSYETRFLIGEACIHYGKTWIYGGTRGSVGMSKNFIYGEDEPCMRCWVNYEVVKYTPPCSTDGFLNTVTSTVAAIEANEAIKILTGSDMVRKDMLYFDLWKNEIKTLPLLKNEHCPVCVNKEFSYYGKNRGLHALELCGRNSVQVVPENDLDIDFDLYAEKLGQFGTVTVKTLVLDFDDGQIGIRLFKNGRAVIKNCSDLNRAKSLYMKYINI